MFMRKVIAVSVVVVALIASYLAGRMTYRSQVAEYLDQDFIDSQEQLGKLKSCEIELREAEEMNMLERGSFSALWSCVQEYSLLFDLTKFDQKYSIDEVQRIRECL